MPQKNKPEFNARKQKLSAVLKQKKTDCLLITKKENIFYLTGLNIQDALLAVSDKGEAVVFSDPRYELELSCRVPAADGFYIYRDTKQPFLKFIFQVLKEKKFKAIAVEDTCSYYLFLSLKKYVPLLKSVHHAVEEVRQIKSPAETALIRDAAKITRCAISNSKNKFKTGMSEKKIAFEIEKYVFESARRKASMAFDVLVTTGPRIALPHGLPSSRKVKNGECILVDIGVKVGGYNSDLTRMLSVGRISSNNKKIIKILKDAQNFAIDKIKPGVTAGAVDKAARDFIDMNGYAKFFTHATGHGVGLEVHEGPVIAPANKKLLKTGMVFTIEPAIYIPGIGGGRIEDMVLVTEKGSQVI